MDHGARIDRHRIRLNRVFISFAGRVVSTPMVDYSTKTPRVIETTHKFKDYYGVKLDNEECKCFVLQNVLPMVKTLIEKINAIEADDPESAAIG